ncbi:unnamed protein product [Caenorhabditis auriculariae]|uniref:Branched-chain-amino-acid aminotransferase n=1 Tax=Caenorhabditis auriculariae TaxID=2777116 RepID=A0A8S1GW06_9PELO|nr:unnamed protein product [Caenorhabditis auriculariae]
MLRLFPFNSTRFLSRGLKNTCSNSFQHKDLIIRKTEKRFPKPKNTADVPFGKIYSDHLLNVDWVEGKGWGKPEIRPFEGFQLHPAAKVLHSSLELFEGAKAYYGIDGKIRIFRPQLNMERMRRSAERCAFPDFDAKEAVKLLKELVKMDSDWVPRCAGSSLYLRPTMIGTEPTLGLAESKEVKLFMICSPVGQNYFKSEGTGVRLLADTSFVRSWPGGVGSYKMGCNYAPTIYVQQLAAKRDCHQVMWLQGKEQLVTEAGAMNLFMFWKNEQGEEELITAPLDTGLLLPGITRRSILELAREWGEFKVSERSFTMADVVKAIDENRVYEFFSSGTAAVVGGISEIQYVDRSIGVDRTLRLPTMASKHKVMQRMYDTITGIQYGRIQKDGWAEIVEL